ncbi:MAG: RloB family protein [Tannerella sp.]|jgi:hypothetical protein|nr:RloB family protein [Tannerella sp.]
MNKKRKTLPKAIFIACEGRSTEKNYFQLIGEIFGDELDYALTVYPDENEPKPKSDAVGLVREAISRKDDGFDELWVVFDKDGYTKHEDAFQLAKDNDIKIAFSSIAFEEWVLLHFERNIYAFSKSDCKDGRKKYICCGTHAREDDCKGSNCVAGYMREKKYYLGYSKSSEISIYPFLKDKTGHAILNSAWLRFRLRKEILECGEKLFEINPFTNVDDLVKRLTGIDESHRFAAFGETIDSDDVSVTFYMVDGQIRIDFTNKSGNSVVFNQITIDSTVEITGEDKKISATIDNSHLINPGMSDVIVLNLSEKLTNDLELTFRIENQIYHIK